MSKILNIQKLGLEIKISATVLYTDIKIAISHTRQIKWHGKLYSIFGYSGGKGTDIKMYAQSSMETTDNCK